MKRAEVGRFRIMLDDRGEGAVVIDHTEPEGRGNKTMILEPGELADLLVALDGVSNDLPPRKRDESRLNTIREILREAQHKLYAVGVRYHLEMQVNTEALYDLASEAGRLEEITTPRAHIGELDLQGPGKLVAVRGYRV